MHVLARPPEPLFTLDCLDDIIHVLSMSRTNKILIMTYKMSQVSKKCEDL